MCGTGGSGLVLEVCWLFISIRFLDCGYGPEISLLLRFPFCDEDLEGSISGKYQIPIKVIWYINLK